MKTVLITGASRGIGRGIAKKFARMGDYNVVINYNQSEELALELAEKIGGFAVKADIGNSQEVKDMIDIVNQKFGKIDVLINNAGISKFNLFSDITEDEWQEMININLSGAYRVTQGAIGGMIREHSGVIINISSMWGEVGSSCEVAYSTAKAGLIGMTKALAKELGTSNIRVNCIAPGLVDTDMNGGITEDAMDGLIEETPLMRIGKPSDIAALAYFLASDESSFITGQVVGSNGGYVI